MDGTRNSSDDQAFPEDDQQLTPPHGDELRSGQTFGRTDRYANVDDKVANREQSIVEKGSSGGDDVAMPTITGDGLARGGDAIVQDRVTLGRDLDGDDEDPVDRRAP